MSSYGYARGPGILCTHEISAKKPRLAKTNNYDDGVSGRHSGAIGYVDLLIHGR